MGGSLSLHGTFQSVSQVIALPTKGSKSETSFKSLTPSPKAANASAFGPPILVTLSVVAGAIVNGRVYQVASNKFDHFNALIKGQSPSSIPSPEQLEAAAQVFEEVSYTFWVAAIVFTVWTVYAVLFSLAVLVVGTLIMKSLRSSLNDNHLNTINFPTFDDAVTTFFPSRVIPEGVETLHDKDNRPINKKAKRAVLHSAVKLILFLSLGILVGGLGFSCIAGFASARIYEISLESPGSAQLIVSRLLLAASWMVSLHMLI